MRWYSCDYCCSRSIPAPAYRTGLVGTDVTPVSVRGVRGNDRSNLRQDEQTALEKQTFTEGDRISCFEFFDEFSGLFVGFLRHFDL